MNSGVSSELLNDRASLTPATNVAGRRRRRRPRASGAPATRSSPSRTAPPISPSWSPRRRGCQRKSRVGVFVGVAAAVAAAIVAFAFLRPGRSVAPAARPLASAAPSATLADARRAGPAATPPAPTASATALSINSLPDAQEDEKKPAQVAGPLPGDKPQKTVEKAPERSPEKPPEQVSGDKQCARSPPTRCRSSPAPGSRRRVGDTPAAPPEPPPPRSRDVLWLVVSGLVVLAGAAAAQHRDATPNPAATTDGQGLPPPLPSGAPPRALEELPADDERAAGCHFAERGFGDYGEWRKLPLGRVLVPAGRAVAGDGSFRLLVHFHGAEPVRKQLAPEGLDLVIAAIDAGVGSRAYDRALADPAAFDQLVAAVEAEVASANHLPAARARSVALSSWSAGYGAVAQILPRRDPRVQAVVLLDSLYAGYTDDRRTLDRARLGPFLGVARAALGGGPAFFLTHTAIATPGYGSTAEVASYLLAELGVTAAPVDEGAPAAAYPRTRMFEEGHLWIRGYAGADRDAHCAQLHLLPERPARRHPAGAALEACYAVARMPTERLYHQDPWLLGFEARVLAHATWDGAPSVVLDRSAFYPESGGQMADRGTLSGEGVADVQVDDEGVVHHVLEGGALPAVDAVVSGVVDRARRRVHMALHTGQHMLSRALADVAGADTVSARLGESACTIDVDRDAIDERRLAEAEDLVNAVIDDDVPVRAFFPDPAELAALPLRRAPKVASHVRVVTVGDFDVTPCGGTHCTSSAQVGLVRITGVERYKGKARVTFSAGPRARGDLWREAAVLRELGRGFTCGPLDVAGGVDKLRRELAEARDALGRARGRLADAIGLELCGQASATGRAVAVLDDAGPDLLRALATRITAAPGTVAFLAGRGPEGLAVLVARGAGATIDCGAFLKGAAAQAGGRGGGRPERAEGRLPAGADWPALVASLSACR